MAVKADVESHSLWLPKRIWIDFDNLTRTHLLPLPRSNSFVNVKWFLSKINLNGNSVMQLHFLSPSLGKMVIMKSVSPEQVSGNANAKQRFGPRRWLSIQTWTFREERCMSIWAIIRQTGNILIWRPDIMMLSMDFSTS